MPDTTQRMLNKIKAAISQNVKGATKSFDFFFDSGSLCFNPMGYSRAYVSNKMMKECFDNPEDFEDCIETICLRLRDKVPNRDLEIRRSCMRTRKLKNQLKRKL